MADGDARLLPDRAAAALAACSRRQPAYLSGWRNDYSAPTSAGSDDSPARRQAIDVSESFIVQAPAGSGKTELLIQRLLALLARVEYPEEVVAITFTRKAAAEMKTRLLDALRRAREHPQPQPDHEALTWRLARAVVDRDQARGWHLETEPQQLRIDTVDALNGWLARRLPLAAGAVAGLELVDDARALYQLAARRTVAMLGEDDRLAEAVRALLMALDARLPRLEQLLAELAPRRDQWLRHIQPGADSAAVRQQLELSLGRLVDDHLDALQRRFPADLLQMAGELLDHCGTAAGPGDGTVGSLAGDGRAAAHAKRCAGVVR